MHSQNDPNNASELATISDATICDTGVLTHRVISPYQGAETKIHVLMPSPLDSDICYRTVYLLPVALADSESWGNAMKEVVERRLHEQFALVFVMPTFSHAPWYADHPTNPSIRQESHFLKVVVPAIESRYPVVSESSGRLLLGFSKSGWGAYSLLLRHPNVFGKAAAWDAPLGQQSPTKYGMGEIFPTQAAFEPYCVWELLVARSDLLSEATRLALHGYGVFRGHHQATHYRMLKHGILHDYQDGPTREHDWHGGWVTDAVEFLARESVSHV